MKKIYERLIILFFLYIAFQRVLNKSLTVTGSGPSVQNRQKMKQSNSNGIGLEF